MLSIIYRLEEAEWQSCLYDTRVQHHSRVQTCCGWNCRDEMRPPDSHLRLALASHKPEALGYTQKHCNIQDQNTMKAGTEQNVTYKVTSHCKEKSITFEKNKHSQSIKFLKQV